MFEGPEFASYIALCRELRLEREIQDGDCVVFAARDDSQPGRWVGRPPQPGLWIWLPLLHQWLDKLKAAGRTLIVFDSNEDGTAWQVAAGIDWGYEELSEPVGRGPTPEEAAGRLWVAVTHEIEAREGVSSA